MHKRKKKGECGMLKHKIGPYSVVDDFLYRGSQRILNPAMAVIRDGECCIVPKIGGKAGILKWHTATSGSRKNAVCYCAGKGENFC